jgi:hypothetical protein
VSTTSRPSGPRRVRLLAEVWFTWALVTYELRRRPLPDAVARIGSGGRAAHDSSSDGDHAPDARFVGRFIWRRLKLGPWQPTCLPRALVLYRLVRRQGASAVVVIGLPRDPQDKDAHAWVEIDGEDVGPPPGGRAYQELARYA